jgi:hypothetical protein
VRHFCVRKKGKNGRSLYLPLCNGESLKVLWILMFLVGVWFYSQYEKKGKIVHINITQSFVILMY